MLTVEYNNIVEGFEDKINAGEWWFNDLSADAAELFQNRTAKNIVSIDGKGINLRDYSLEFYKGGYLGLISQATSLDDGYFDVNPYIWIDRKDTQIDGKMTLKFHRDYCDMVTITYLAGENIITRQVIYPNNRVYSFTPLSAYNICQSMKIEFVKTHTPNSFVWLSGLVVGEIKWFTKFKNADLLEEINIISDDLPINSFNFEVITDEDVDFIEGQSLNVYANDQYFGKFYIISDEQIAPNVYRIEALDVNTLLEKRPYYGSKQVFERSVWDEFNGNKYTLLTPPNVSIEFETDFDNLNTTLVGGIPNNKTCRYALCGYAYALNKMIDTSRTDTVKFISIPNKVSRVITNKDKRIIGNAIFTKQQPISSIEYLYIYAVREFAESNETIGVIPNGPTKIEWHNSPRKIIDIIPVVEREIDTAYVTQFNTDASTVNVKHKSVQFQKQYFPLTVIKSDNENKIEYKEFEVRSGAANIKLSNLYKNAKSKGIVKAKIVLQGEKVGDLISIETVKDSMITGIITSINIVSFGYDIIANIEVKEWQNG